MRRGTKYQETSFLTGESKLRTYDSPGLCEDVTYPSQQSRASEKLRPNPGIIGKNCHFRPFLTMFFFIHLESVLGVLKKQKLYIFIRHIFLFVMVRPVKENSIFFLFFYMKASLHTLILKQQDYHSISKKQIKDSFLFTIIYCFQRCEIYISVCL